VRGGCRCHDLIWFYLHRAVGSGRDVALNRGRGERDIDGSCSDDDMMMI
jgi:hypothetical protein